MVCCNFTIVFGTQSLQRRLFLARLNAKRGASRDEKKVQWDRNEREVARIREVLRFCTNKIDCRRGIMLGMGMIYCEFYCDNCARRPLRLASIMEPENGTVYFDRWDVTRAARSVLMLNRRESVRKRRDGLKFIPTQNQLDEAGLTREDIGLTRAELEKEVWEKLKVIIDGITRKIPKRLIQQLACHMFQEEVFDLKPVNRKEVSLRITICLSPSDAVFSLLQCFISR